MKLDTILKCLYHVYIIVISVAARVNTGALKFEIWYMILQE